MILGFTKYNYIYLSHFSTKPFQVNFKNEGNKNFR